MRILFLSDDFPPMSFGGAGISTYELARGMKKAGHEVFVITTCRKKTDSVEIEYKGLKIFRIVSDYPPRWRAYVSLYNVPVVGQVKKILERIKPDVVHANNIHYHLSYYCLKLARHYAKVVVFTARDTMSVCYGKLGGKRYVENFDCRTTWYDHLKTAKKRWNPVHNFIVKRYLQSVDKVFAVSDALKIALLQNGIRDVAVIHTGEDVDRWDVVGEEVFQFREHYNVQNKKIILFGGRLSEAKGGRKALEALAEIVKVVPDSVLLVVGTVDEYAEKMKEQAKKMIIVDSIIFTGWVDQNEIKLAYAVADVVLVPSLYLDPFPRVVLEAMAAGKPVIGTRYGGTPEIIQDGVTGYVVDPFSVNEMSERAIGLLTDTDKAVRFGESAKRRVETDFNLDEKVREYLTAYESLLRNT